jgi:excisionase family DNA binding protein
MEQTEPRPLSGSAERLGSELRTLAGQLLVKPEETTALATRLLKIADLLDSSGEPAMDVTAIAAYLGVSEYTVRRCLKNGQIPGRKYGKEWRSTRQAIDADLNARAA